MTCCGGNITTECATELPQASDMLREEELKRSARHLPDGRAQHIFSVPAIHCGRCIATIEKAVARLPGVSECRVNLTLRRVSVTLEKAAEPALPIVKELERLGYPATPVDLGDAAEMEDRRQTANMLKALAVAGFAAANIMLLSLSVWSGADGSTRDLFHLISALIAIPAVAYSGQVFFRSALTSLKGRHLNMDVPISLAVILALFMSVYETVNGGEEAYFDAAVTLLFFLLIGRYLDRLMRDRARSAVIGLSRLAAKGAMKVNGETLEFIAIDEIEPGMVLRVAAGERIPVDAAIASGRSDLDRSLVTGESAPAPAAPGDEIEAGTLNISGPIDITALRRAENSFLAEVLQMLQEAEKGRGHYVRIADRMAALYAPVVHLLALAAFITWMVATGGDWHASIYTAIAVLIITCPCALGLAVPVVHVIASARLFEEGILAKDGSALERLAEATLAVFDKTGTITTGAPEIGGTTLANTNDTVLAAALARQSTHPASRAVARHLADAETVALETIREFPGCGMEVDHNGKKIRLGRHSWVAELASGGTDDATASAVWFAVEGKPLRHFALAETLRADAKKAIGELGRAGLVSELLSGDTEPAVTATARAIGVDTMRYGQLPADKIARIGQLQEAGEKVLMVGDGLNDAPSLAAAHVSIAPASACDVGRMAADFVFTRESLNAAPFARKVSVAAGRLVRQNFGLAILYNSIAVPLAFLGYVTPLFAAIAMSASSIVVVANSLRLLRIKAPTQAPTTRIEKAGRSGQTGRLAQAA